MEQVIRFFVLVVFCGFISCSEEYQLTGVDHKSVIVVEGGITDEPGPYFIRISACTTNLRDGKISRQGIDDARVIISNNRGNIDILQPFCNLKPDSVLYAEYYAEVEYYKDCLKIPNFDSGFTPFWLEYSYNYETQVKSVIVPQGYYYTTNIEGIPGDSYSLTVEYNGQEYTATDQMPYGSVLDSVSLEPVGIYFYDKEDGIKSGFDVPCLYFKEPQNEVNFYMFNYMWGYDGYGYNAPYPEYQIKFELFRMPTYGNIGWSYSVLSDKFLPPSVEKYKLSQGDSPLSYYTGTDVAFLDNDFNGFTTFMWNISEPAYHYFYALSQQFYDDGGSFSPAPTSPPTNLSNGAQGFFVLASVSSYMLKDVQK
jgi:hypothetical protein